MPQQPNEARRQSADEARAEQELTTAWHRLEQWIHAPSGGGEEGLPLVHDVQTAEAAWRTQSLNAAARSVVRYLLDVGQPETARVVFLLLLAEHDIWRGWTGSYTPGDERRFVEEAGRWAVGQVETAATG